MLRLGQLLLALLCARPCVAHGDGAPRGPITNKLVALEQNLVGPAAPVLVAVPFVKSDVTLDPTSLFGIGQKRNHAYLLSLNNSELMCYFTSAANLTRCEADICPSPGTGGNSTVLPPLCNPLAGEMTTGGYYGHFLGHWLSATSFMFNNTGDVAVRDKSADVVHTLAEVMQAWLAKYGESERGYLFPYDPYAFEILEMEAPHPAKAIYSVPFYTLHKIMAGLLDQWTDAHNEEAFKCVTEMADWVVRNVARTVKRGGEDLWQKVLQTEWGGMNEVMFNLYSVTQNPDYLSTGYLFNHWSWSRPLAAGVDDLAGQHANTHIAEVLGNNVAYELTGNATDKAVSVAFFAAVTQNHSWATGGSNEGEYWQTARQMGDSLTSNTEESCTQYNMLKMARHLFTWTANSTLFDFYERAILNGLLGNQNQLDPAMTSFIYMLPLGTGGMVKPWGKSNEHFRCCWGTLSETFSKLTDSIYFQSPDASTMFVNQFVGSSVTWRERGVVITQSSKFPVDANQTTSIVVKTAVGSGTGSLPAQFTMKIRVPAWATDLSGNTVLVNGKPVEGVTVEPGTYFAISRKWQEGDKVDVQFPMLFSTSPLNDIRPEFANVLAYMYGPLVLAGVYDSVSFVPENPHKPASFITRNSTSELTFEAVGLGATGSPTKMLMIPLYKVMMEEYTVYFHTSGSPVVPYNPGGAVVPSHKVNDLIINGASVEQWGPPDQSCSDRTVKSGLSHQTGLVRLGHSLKAKGHFINRVTMQFRYATGLAPQHGEHKENANLTISLVQADSPNAVLHQLYQSPPLTEASFDGYWPTGWSKPVMIDASGFRVANDEPVSVQLNFNDNDRYLVIPIDDLNSEPGFNVKVYWENPIRPDAHYPIDYEAPHKF